LLGFPLSSTKIYLIKYLPKTKLPDPLPVSDSPQPAKVFQVLFPEIGSPETLQPHELSTQLYHTSHLNHELTFSTKPLHNIASLATSLPATRQKVRQRLRRHPFNLRDDSINRPSKGTTAPFAFEHVHPGLVVRSFSLQTAGLIPLFLLSAPPLTQDRQEKTTSAAQSNPIQ